MVKQEGLRQLVLFPELVSKPSLPSISTLPEFDRALDNLLKMSDLGAFISINVHGVDKSYSIHTSELEIPLEFLKDEKVNHISDTIHLFPDDVRQHLRKLTYEVKSFFNRKNSFKTPFGYFLYRPYFRIWSKFVTERKQHVEQFLLDTLKGRTYGQLFLKAFDCGYRFLEETSDDTAPWEFLKTVFLHHIQETRQRLIDNHQTLHTLDKTFPDYPLKAVALKTAHFPLDLSHYIRQLDIRFAFKSIHLEYLKEVSINSVEDVKRISEKMGKGD